MWPLHISTLLLFVVVHCSTVNLGFDADLQNGIERLHQDLTSGLKVDGIDYLPLEITENLEDIRWYLSGGHNYKLSSLAGFDLTCSGCITGVNTAFNLYKSGVPFDTISGTAKTLCKAVLKGEMCDGFVRTYKDSLEYIVEHDSNFSGKKLCGLALGGKCGAWENIYDFDINFSGRPNDEKPEFQKPQPPKPGSKISKVLHLSDVHLDLSYQIGTDIDCGLFMCCMNTTAMATDPTKSAGNWGSYPCDLPYWTYEDMLAHIKETHFEDIDYIMLTGDYPAHDIWFQTRENNLAHAKAAINAVKTYFPDTKVIPSLGNHEAAPCNLYPPSKIKDETIGILWLYSELRKLFGNWIPDEAEESFLKNGFFTYLMHPGFRIVVLNSNSYLGYNFFLNLDYEDPFGMLQWLYDVLLEAERNGEKVHIVSHAPTSDAPSVGGFGKNYAKVLDRFANTVTASFYGHTHNDQFALYYDTEKNSVPIHVGFVNPSVTTYTGLNPSYRIYHVDGPYEGASMRVLDHETYIMDLAKANKNEVERPVYFKLYQAKEDLKMDNLFPEDYDKLARQMIHDEDLYTKFFNYYNSNSTGDDHSKKVVICYMTSPTFLDTRKCDELFNEQHN